MRKTILLIYLILIATVTWAQFEDYEAKEMGHTSTKKDTTQSGSMFVFGGDLGLQLGTNTMIKIAPAVGHYLTSYLLPGVSITYIYTQDKFYNTRGNVVGGSIFLEAFPFSFVVLHAEYEKLRANFSYLTQPYWTDSYLAGIGYRQTIGRKGMINYLVLWDFNYSSNKIYSNPRFKIIMLF